MVATGNARRSNCTRCAFTLVELLIVITIIAILMALLIPAVMYSQDAGRRLKCKNNLKQIGVAIRNYETRYQRFPPGGITEGPCCGTKSLTSWAISILPFLEQQPLYERYDMKAFNEDPVNEFVRQAVLDIYACPAEEGVGQLDIPESGPGGTWGAHLKYRRGSYRCMTGKSNGDGWWDADQNTMLPLHWRGIMHQVADRNVKRDLTTERLGNVVDGTSNTLMVGEMTTLSHQSRRTFWAYSYTSYNASAAVPQSRTLLVDYDKCRTIGGRGGSNPCKRGWGSFHPQGLHFVLVDGSVHLINGNIDINLFADLATIAGDEGTQLPDR
jgi:prepilin-type N-terminal cleavage/methylation domain-containing protein